MAISPDVLASTLVDLAPKFSDTFSKWHPFIEKIVEKNNIDMSTLQGPYKEFAVVSGGPGDVDQIVHGDDLLTGHRRQLTVRGNSYAPRLMYSYVVPGKDLAEANGKQDLVRIIKMYPQLGLKDFMERIANQLGRAASSAGVPQHGNGGCEGFITFNGDQSYFPQGPASPRTGIFEMDHATAQNDTVFGIAKEDAASGVSGWKHQAAHITNFPLNGRDTLRKVIGRAQREGSTLGKGPDLMLSDEQTYLNYIRDLDAHVRTPTVTEDKGPKAVRDGIPFMGGTLYVDDSIDISDTTCFTTADAQQGVLYAINTDCWFGYSVGHDAGMETKGLFAQRKPIRLERIEGWRYETVLSLGFFCNDLRANALITGGANR